ncbi:MAG: hypothetical protein HQK84_08830 [Nitrospinae bacterium]|nr:hypothetical protein [Nitrospinota bacterium]
MAITMGNKTTSDTGPSTSNDPNISTNVFKLARIIVFLSIGGILLIVLFSLTKATTIDDATKTLNIVLPVFGTWVGTIIAYYFSKENFESASKSMQTFVDRITPEQKLKSFLVKEKMIPLQSITKLIYSPEGKTLLKSDLLDGLLKDNNRLPVLNSDMSAKYIIHKSMINSYIAQKALTPTLGNADLSQLTLQGLLTESPKLEEFFKNSFTIAKEDDNLADIKTKMDSNKSVQDVFVTKNGKADEAITGWITNIMITEVSKMH